MGSKMNDDSTYRKVVIGDGEARVDAVHATQGGASAVAVVAVFEHLAENDGGVVIAFLGALVKFAGAVQQRGDAGHREVREAQDFVDDGAPTQHDWAV